MGTTPLAISALIRKLNDMDGKSYRKYGALSNNTYDAQNYLMRFLHIQRSPGAFPASVVQLEMDHRNLELDGAFLSNPPRRLATADYLLRRLREAVQTHARQNRGAQGSGSFQPLELPPQVLQRNLVHFDHGALRLAFHISLPGSKENRIVAAHAIAMFEEELPAIIRHLRKAAGSGKALKVHCDVVEDMIDLQGRLSRYNLVAFVGDGAILPRQSGISSLPLKTGAVAFHAPDDLAVKVDMPHAGRVRGLGIRPGVNVVIGGAFHGKSTLLQALAKAVYPHIPGDGRERVVTHPDAAVICSEEGRAVTGLDISGFIDRLPSRKSTRRFSTSNASGSTSQAAATVESLLSGVKMILLDEDTSAANFLARDPNMRRLIPEETIIPLIDRVGELHRQWRVSTLMVLGGSSTYLGAADHVVAMRNYQPVNMTGRALELDLPQPPQPPQPLAICDRRQVLAGNFDPRYDARRLGKTLDVRIKPLRLQPGVLEYGNQRIDLTCLDALVDPHQVMAIGYALLQAGARLDDRLLSPSDLADALDDLIAGQGLDTLAAGTHAFIPLARPRRLELAAAINRVRDLQVQYNDD
ncbi:MAG: ABC-ATPase domain-containing protein [Desulfobacteraceae bacterium]